jgi:uncharacterized membrane protein YgaE (UPF0421/DUF939 family)
MKENCYLISTNKNRGNKKEYNANENVEQLIYYVKEEEKIIQRKKSLKGYKYYIHSLMKNLINTSIKKKLICNK